MRDIADLRAIQAWRQLQRGRAGQVVDLVLREAGDLFVPTGPVD